MQKEFILKSHLSNTVPLMFHSHAIQNKELKLLQLKYTIQEK